MRKRLQVVLDEAELKKIRQVARRHKLSVAEWVRQALRAARKREPASDRVRKLQVIREAYRHRFPAGSIEEMLEEIERGYLADASR